MRCRPGAGIVANVSGFSIYGDYATPNPPAEIIRAVANKEIDVAIVWGPLAGYFATRQEVPMVMTPVSPQIDVPFLPFVYDIAMGVRRDNPALKAEVEGVLIRKRAEIEARDPAKLQAATDAVQQELDGLDSLAQTSSNLSESRRYIAVEVNLDGTGQYGDDLMRIKQVQNGKWVVVYPPEFSPPGVKMTAR